MLGVQKNAGDDDLKRGYKKLALKLHPDKNQAAGSEQAFKGDPTTMGMTCDVTILCTGAYPA